jgi:hypothetical protein
LVIRQHVVRDERAPQRVTPSGEPVVAADAKGVPREDSVGKLYGWPVAVGLTGAAATAILAAAFKQHDVWVIAAIAGVSLIVAGLWRMLRRERRRVDALERELGAQLEDLEQDAAGVVVLLSAAVQLDVAVDQKVPGARAVARERPDGRDVAIPVAGDA